MTALSGDDRLRTVDEACMFLRVSRRTLYRMLKSGSLRAVRTRGARGARRFTVDELSRFSTCDRTGQVVPNA